MTRYGTLGLSRRGIRGTAFALAFAMAFTLAAPFTPTAWAQFGSYQPYQPPGQPGYQAWGQYGNGMMTPNVNPYAGGYPSTVTWQQQGQTNFGSVGGFFGNFVDTLTGKNNPANYYSQYGYPTTSTTAYPYGSTGTAGYPYGATNTNNYPYSTTSGQIPLTGLQNGYGTPMMNGYNYASYNYGNSFLRAIGFGQPLLKSRGGPGLLIGLPMLAIRGVVYGAGALIIGTVRLLGAGISTLWRAVTGSRQQTASLQNNVNGLYYNLPGYNGQLPAGTQMQVNGQPYQMPYPYGVGTNPYVQPGYNFNQNLNNTYNQATLTQANLNSAYTATNSMKSWGSTALANGVTNVKLAGLAILSGTMKILNFGAMVITGAASSASLALQRSIQSVEYTRQQLRLIKIMRSNGTYNPNVAAGYLYNASGQLQIANNQLTGSQIMIQNGYVGTLNQFQQQQTYLNNNGGMIQQQLNSYPTIPALPSTSSALTSIGYQPPFVQPLQQNLIATNNTATQFYQNNGNSWFMRPDMGSLPKVTDTGVQTPSAAATTPAATTTATATVAPAAAEPQVSAPATTTTQTATGISNATSEANSRYQAAYARYLDILTNKGENGGQDVQKAFDDYTAAYTAYQKELGTK